MAKIHVLQGGNDVYTVVVHSPTPAGNNGAGVPWATAIANSGNNTSIMAVGNGPGQITTAELNNVQNGSVIEGVFQWGDEPGWTNAERQADLDLRANQLVNDLLAGYQQRLKYFGFTRT